MKKLLYVVALLLGSVLLIGKVEAKITMTGLKEAASDAVSYFDNKENFTSNGVFNEQSFNQYQPYVNKIKNADLSNYSESDDKVNVYIFRGATCWHCLDEITFFTTKASEYGKYFNIKTYEVWNNTDNSKLMSTVAKKLGKSADGVPFTVIGKETYSGFSETYGEQMLNAIQEQYKTSDRYDIKNDINMEDGTLINGKEENNNTTLIIVLIVIILFAGIATIYYVSKK